jgi:predicted N-acetyltransferase YhbS
MNRYLQKQAGQDQKRRAAACFVFCEEGKVLGYYTLSSATLGLDELPESWQRKLPKYPRVPATLMGRLAIDTTTRGRRLGEALLFDGLFRALDASLTVASFAVMVDALEIEPDPLPFYEQYGFTKLEPNSRTLFVPMSTVAKLPRKR